MRQRYFAGLAAVCGISLLIAGCGGSTNSGSTTSSDSKTVRLIQGGGLDFSDAAIYKAMALLKAEGYKVSLANVADPTTALRAVLAGKADVYLGDPVEAATAVANGGAAVKYIASIAQTSNYEIIALPKYTLKNLSGAKLATAGAGTAGQIVAIAALQKLGINSSEVHQVVVGGTSARVTAILAGQVDLAPVLASDAAAAVATGKVKILVNTGDVLGNYLQQGLIASDSFAAEKSTAQATVDAFIEAERWAASNQSGYVSLVNANGLSGGLTKTEEATAWAQLKAGNFFALNGAVCSSAISQTLSYSYLTPGGLTKSNTPAQSKWVDASYVNAYLTSHGQSAGTC
jgi:ABC-type nitrate/sulfonate/bicarbonate transport system substrate-binding protein